MRKRSKWLLVFVFVLFVGCGGPTDSSNEMNFELSDYDYVGTFKNGDEVYIESYQYNMQDAAWRMVLVRDQKIYKNFEGMPSKPKFSRDRTKMVYIDNLQFEAIGNIIVYDSVSEEEKAYTDFDYYNSQETVKDVEWYKNEKLLCIIGYSMGTVTQGGQAYILDMASKEYSSLNLDDAVNDWTDNPYEIVDLYPEKDGMKVLLVEWTDDNYNEFHYSNHFLTYEDITYLE